MRVEERLRRRRERAAAALVDRVRGVDQVACDSSTSHSAPFASPPSSSAVSARMMSRSGTSALLLASAAGWRRRSTPSPCRRRAAAEEVAVLLVEHERIARPVGAARRDDVEVREQEDRLRASSRRGRDSARRGCPCRLAAGIEHLHVARRKAGGAEARGHRLGGLRHGADGVDGVDLDELACRSRARARWCGVRVAGEGGGADCAPTDVAASTRSAAARRRVATGASGTCGGGMRRRKTWVSAARIPDPSPAASARWRRSSRSCTSTASSA